MHVWSPTAHDLVREHLLRFLSSCRWRVFLWVSNRLIWMICANVTQSLRWSPTQFAIIQLYMRMFRDTQSTQQMDNCPSLSNISSSFDWGEQITTIICAAIRIQGYVLLNLFVLTHVFYWDLFAVLYTLYCFRCCLGQSLDSYPPRSLFHFVSTQLCNAPSSQWPKPRPFQFCP